jgi:hypothetical protein
LAKANIGRDDCDDIDDERTEDQGEDAAQDVRFDRLDFRLQAQRGLADRGAKLGDVRFRRKIGCRFLDRGTTASACGSVKPASCSRFVIFSVSIAISSNPPRTVTAGWPWARDHVPRGLRWQSCRVDPAEPGAHHPPAGDGGFPRE